MDHNLTEYRVVVTGDRCGRTRTYTVRSAWMDVVVAAAIASGLKPTTADTQGATVAVQRRAEAAPAAQDGDRDWHVCGPWPTHAEALAALADVCAYAGQRDPRAAFMGWGTGRLGLEHAPIRALVQVAELEAARARWAEEAAERAQPPRARRAEPGALTMRGRAPRKAAKARKSAKGSAGTSEAGEGSQSQPEATGEMSATAPVAVMAEPATTATLPAAEGTDG